MNCSAALCVLRCNDRCWCYLQMEKRSEFEWFTEYQICSVVYQKMLKDFDQCSQLLQWGFFSLSALLWKLWHYIVRKRWMLDNVYWYKNSYAFHHAKSFCTFLNYYAACIEALCLDMIAVIFHYTVFYLK